MNYFLNCYLSFITRNLFNGLEVVFAEFVHFAGEHSLWLGGAVNAVRLDGNDRVAACLQELVRVLAHDLSLENEIK
jgi:hypothetical protein